MRRGEFSYRSLHGAKPGRRRLLYTTLVVLAVIMLDVATGGSLRSMARSIGASVWQSTASMRASVAGTGFFSTHRALAHENAALQAEVVQYRERAAGYDALKQEIELLRSMVHLAQSEKGAVAPVVSSFSASPYGTFLIGAGSRDSIAVGDLVMTDGGFVVGRIAQVDTSTALVKGVFSSDSSIDVMFDNAAAVAHGIGGGNARIAVPRGVTVTAGDPVVAPSLGGRPVGVVGRVESDPARAEQMVYASLPVNLSLTRFVFIVHAPGH